MRTKARLLFPASLCLVLSLLLGACSSSPRKAPEKSTSIEQSAEPKRSARKTRQARAPVGTRVAGVAETMLGVPYVYGGKTPRGFDCSGLVHYAYHQLGIDVPRTAADQLRRSKPIHLRQLEAGDLVFFRHKREPVSHVGIYLGNDQFIHAPSSGKRVSYGTIGDGYYRDHFYAGGRLH